MMLIGKHRVLQFILAGLILLFCGIAWMAYSAASCALTAERALHANQFVVAVLRDYVVDSGGTWPRSWQDLENMRSRQYQQSQWPEALNRARQYVSVDFEADLDKLATQSREEFDAVKPLGPCYPFKHYGEVDQLLDTIRQLKAKKPEGPTRPASTSPDR